ncbi:uncharacterized protein LOC128826605 [Malaclemys terrapin pileata]|uniref:uncharacterized protein LOC128826605 n=1 Tax=Malaclemys terrapin pileata TaxID=2991368 RepID=UPI0023A7DF7F|nr:uncharacterized protein LOC128826605 [Malaclemys terrapin pileata]
MPRAGLLLLPFLLCFGPETAGSIDPAALKVIVDYVNQPITLREFQYAFVVSLRREKCDQPTNLQEQLPKEALNDMNKALTKQGSQYIPNNWPIVAARPKSQRTHWEHSERRLLNGGQNSLVAQLKARTCTPNCCLILFTFNSPCTSMCLVENGPYNILSMTSNTFSDVNNNYKAFVFQRIYANDTRPVVTRHELLQAWHRLPNVSLLRCDHNGCQDCAATDPENNPCLAGKIRNGAGNRVRLFLPLASLAAHVLLAR